MMVKLRVQLVDTESGEVLASRLSGPVPTDLLARDKDRRFAQDRYKLMVGEAGMLVYHQAFGEDRENQSVDDDPEVRIEHIAKFLRLNYVAGMNPGAWEDADQDERDAWLAEASHVFGLAVR